MKLLLCVQTIVDVCDGRYFHNSVSAFVDNYKPFCDELICLSILKDVDKSQAKIIESEGVSFVHTYKINSLNSLFADKKKNDRIIEQQVKSVDKCIIHLPSTTGEQVVKYAKKYNKPYLAVVVACAWDGLWNYDFRGKIMAPFRFFSTRRAVIDSPYALYVTQEFLQRRYPTKGKQLGCSDVKIAPVTESVLTDKLDRLSQLNKEKRPITLTTIASIEVPYKGQVYVIEAISRLKKLGLDFEYHLIGGGNSTRLVNAAKKFGVSDRVFFHGLVSHDVVFDSLDKTDIYVQPSKQEGLPRAVVEAMSRACPVIGSNIAGIPELLEPNCLFKAGDVGAICKLLKEFSVDKLTHCAKRNFEESKNFEFTSLQKRRREFIEKFIDE